MLLKGGFNVFLLKSLTQTGSKYVFKPNEAHLNVYDTVHGGIISSLIDITTSLEVMKVHENHGVSVDLSVQYIRALSTTFTLEPIVEKIGKSLIFTSCQVYDSNRRLAAVGRHIKMYKK